MSSEHRPRRDDHLVEPLFGALREAPRGSDATHGRPTRARARLLGWVLLLGLAAVAAYAAIR